MKSFVSENIVGLAAVSGKQNDYEKIYEDSDVLREMIRESMFSAGLGTHDPNAPIADIIKPGDTVLLKPNWVLHYNKSGHGMGCMVTHPEFIIAVLKEVLSARPGKVIIGDAPLQICEFYSVFHKEWVEKAKRLADCPVEIVDFRRLIARENKIAEGFKKNLRKESQYVVFDLGKSSLLEPISEPEGRFRVTNYNPEELMLTHQKGIHKYLLCKEALQSDVVLNLPKLKTHKKTGFTGSLKNIVGLNGSKEYLPHHRKGGSFFGGDCYPGVAPLKLGAEFFLDMANRRIGSSSYSWWARCARLLLYTHSLLFRESEIDGGWFGNDTAWRMVLDLNRILLYGCNDGKLKNTQQRIIYSICDGIVAGESEGPLAPTPCHLGVVTFASSSYFSDLAHASLMGFDWKKIPMLSQCFGEFEFPLAKREPHECIIYHNKRMFSLEEIYDYAGRKLIPPSGWKEILN